jgi:hypothetical protein
MPYFLSRKFLVPERWWRRHLHDLHLSNPVTWPDLNLGDTKFHMTVILL